MSVRPGWGGSGRSVLEYAFGFRVSCSSECSDSGVSAGRGAGAGARFAGGRRPARWPEPRGLGGPAAGLAGGIGGGVRHAGRGGAVAGGAAAHVRPGGGRAPAVVLLRRG